MVISYNPSLDDELNGTSSGSLVFPSMSVNTKCTVLTGELVDRDGRTRALKVWASRIALPRGGETFPIRGRRVWLLLLLDFFLPSPFDDPLGIGLRSSIASILLLAKFSAMLLSLEESSSASASASDDDDGTIRGDEVVVVVEEEEELAKVAAASPVGGGVPSSSFTTRRDRLPPPPPPDDDPLRFPPVVVVPSPRSIS
jgi:hypothetical protein